ncbi:MAG: DNA methyltransferase [Thermodesulfovibrionales bacterium]|nr:DNA methyltransferase [Thermodesulfovibrionales bacterium]
MTFGRRIKELRSSLGISLKSLSARLKIDRAYLSRVEAGKVPPSDGLISRLADVLDYDRDELFLLAGRISESLMKEIYKNPGEIAKRIKMPPVDCVAEPLVSYGRTLITSGDRTIEDGFPFEFISDIAELESYRKEVTRPIYHIHKWWAQRLGSVFRSILISAAAPKGSNIKEMFYQPVRLTGMTVFDPFMGSGTTIGEALKLGCRVIGRDINPVSYFIVKNALNKYSRKQVPETFAEIEKDVSENLKHYYKTKDANNQLHDVLYYFWVKTLPCPKCRKTVDLFSSYIFSRHAYPLKNPEAKAVCPYCGQINTCRYDSENLRCKHCKHLFKPQNGPVNAANAVCPHCSERFSIAKTAKMSGEPPSHRMYAKLVLKDSGIKDYQAIDKFDETLYLKASKELAKRKNPYPFVQIEPGYNTNQILNYNYKYWHQMFNDRQLLCLSVLAERIRGIKDDSMRSLFACLFSGCLEFNNMFASFKGEGTGAVRHMFSHHILKPERTPLEANLWGTPKSSGSFSTLFKSRLLRSLDYRQNPFESRAERVDKKLTGSKVFGLSCSLGTSIAKSFKEFDEKNMNTYLSCGNSSLFDLPDRSVDLVVTDPPFFDNVHYSELADFFYVWIRHILGERGIFRASTTRAADEVQHIDPQIFSNKLSSVFRECNRILRPEGLLIFTYHHSRHEGWISILEAIVESGFVLTITHPVKSEMSVATPKQQAKEPIDLDIILVCRKRSEWQLMDSIEIDLWNNAKDAAKDQIIRFNRAGRHLSRNDIRVVLMGQIVSRISQIKELKLMKILLTDFENQIEDDINLLYNQQDMKDARYPNTQISIF